MVLPPFDFTHLFCQYVGYHFNFFLGLHPRSLSGQIPSNEAAGNGYSFYLP